MFSQKKNKVARILKIYSILNALVVFLAAIIISFDEGEPIIFIVGFALGVCVNFVIYSFGEVIDLLAQIRDNTKPSVAEASHSIEDELPDL